MDLAAALRAGPALLRRRPAGVLPYYLLVASVPTVARVPLVVATGVAGAWLAATGRLDPVFAALRDLDFAARTGAGPGAGDPTGAGTGPGGPGLPDALIDAAAGLVTPTTVALVGAGAAATVALAVLARAATAAG
ncbi:MAG: stage II sporulation protein M, partial [Haloferacaceae archaeon]